MAPNVVSKVTNPTTSTKELAHNKNYEPNVSKNGTHTHTTNQMMASNLLPIKWVDKEYYNLKYKTLIQKLIPYQLKEQEALLKEQVKRNSQRYKLIGTTCDGKWSEIVKTALATDSNILQIFLTYQEINSQFKNEQEKRYTMLQNREPNMTEDNNIIVGNKAIGLKMILHITLGLYINGSLWVSGQRNWKIIRIIEELARAQEMNIRWTNQWNIGILLENSASNNCYSSTISDLMDI
ncbi:7395_t:CDS:2, partial [Ambispora leptoticha]